MRIIGGKFKGKLIQFLRVGKTRPLKDSVRENIFNILMHSNKLNIRIEGSDILDLYSGIGSFGIECISRGANKVTFIEQEKSAYKILEKNLENLKVLQDSKAINNKIENAINRFKDKFSIFFLDPPFVDSEFIENLKMIKINKMFNKKHLVIIHREKKSKDNFKDILQPILTKEYGRSKIIFGIFI